MIVVKVGGGVGIDYDALCADIAALSAGRPAPGAGAWRLARNEHAGRAAGPPAALRHLAFRLQQPLHRP